MEIKQFELEAAIDASSELSDQYFFFYDKYNTLSAWISRRKRDKLLICAYQKKEKDIMHMIDIQELLVTPESVEIDASGSLLINTNRGTLCLNIKSGKISLDATSLSERKIKSWNEQKPQFPGMKITDQVSIGENNLTRYTTTSNDYYGNGLFEESILCLSAKKHQCKNGSTPLIIIGNSRFDSRLNLVKHKAAKLFDMPIINFAMNYTHSPKILYLLGWNRKRLQAIQVAPTMKNKSLIKIVQQRSTYFKDMKLKDRSTLYTDHGGRLVVLAEEERPYRFYYVHTNERPFTQK